jgi:WD40 repeat protein
VVQDLSGHSGFVVSVAFSPADSAWIASAGSDQQLILWNWRTGRKIYSGRIETALRNGMAYAVAFSPDGQQLAAPGEKGEVIIRDTPTGRVIHRLTGSETEEARCVCFSPRHGRWLATGSDKGIVRVWDANRGKSVKDLGTIGAPIIGVAFDETGRHLASAHVHGFVEVWDTDTWGQLSSYRVGNPILNGLAFHPSSQRLITGGFDRLVIVSDPVARQPVLVFRDLASGCLCLALSPNSHRLAAGSREGTERIHVVCR